MGLSINPRIENIKVSGIRAIYNKLADYPDAINLTVGEPDFPTPDHIKEAAIASINADKIGYSINNGLPQLRQEVHSFFKDKYNLHYDPNDEIIVTVGASEAIDIAFRTILLEGDEVIFFAPAYAGYIPLVEAHGGIPVIIDTRDHGFRPSVAQLKKTINEKTKAIVFNYPCNPTGVTLSSDEVQELAAFLKTQDVYVITDEIYSENTFEGDHVSIASMEGMREKTIVIHGLSKSHSMTGWRIGFNLAPKSLSQLMVKIHAYMVACAPVISQYAAIEALKNGRDDSIPMNESYRQRRDFVYQRLIEMGIEVEKPTGAFYIFPKIPAHFPDSLTFALRLLEEGGVAVVPGSAFSDYGEGYFRITYAYSPETLEEAMNRLEKFITQHSK